jgi:hypothetical protein
VDGGEHGSTVDLQLNNQDDLQAVEVQDPLTGTKTNQAQCGLGSGCAWEPWKQGR